MTVFQKAAELSLESTLAQRNRFYINLFKVGKDWFDVENLVQAVGIKDKHISELYEEWQTARECKIEKCLRN